MTPDELTLFLGKIRVEDDCWIWTASTKMGLPQFEHQGGHRVSYEHYVGPILPGLDLHHECLRPLCVNPIHLTPLTRAQHKEAHSRAHCVSGHLFDKANTYWTPNGTRQCNECRRQRQRDYYNRKRNSDNG